MNTEAFITEIINRPAIWMPKHPHHKMKNVIKRSWEEIKSNFQGQSIDQLKKKWKNLKDHYRKELKKTPLSRSGDPGTSDDGSPQWKYFNLMSFLKEDFMPTETDSNLTENVDVEVNIDECFSDLQDSPPTPQTPGAAEVTPDVSHEAVQIVQSTSQQETAAPFRKRNRPNDIRLEYLEIEKKKLKILEEEVSAKKNEVQQTQQNTPEIEKTDDYYYVMSILPEMQKLKPIQKMRLRNKINQALMDEISINMYEDSTPLRGFYTQMTPSNFTQTHDN